MHVEEDLMTTPKLDGPPSAKDDGKPPYTRAEPIDGPASESEGESSNCEDGNGQLRSQEWREETQPWRKGVRHQCRFCDYASCFKSSVTRHEMRHRGERPFVCGVCQQMFTERSHLRDHERVHTGERPFQCEVCQKKFKQKAHLHKHMRIHTELEEILPTPIGESEQSEDCGNISTSTSHLEGDIGNTSALKEEPVDNAVSDSEGGSSNCEDSNVQEPWEHREESTCQGQGRVNLRCRFCTYTSYKRTDVTRHERTHAGEQLFRCKICQKTFQQKLHLTDHMRIHTGLASRAKADVGNAEESLDGEVGLPSQQRRTVAEKRKTGQRDRRQCRFCSYFSNYTAAVVRHERTHTGEQPFSCRICHRAFSSDYSLLRHERVHTGEKPFSCRICNKAFTQKSYLEVHERVHTGERPFKCQTCQKAFVDRCHLVRHERVHKGERPFKCSMCGSAFTLRSCLTRHEKIHAAEQT